MKAGVKVSQGGTQGVEGGKQEWREVEMEIEKNPITRWISVDMTESVVTQGTTPGPPPPRRPRGLAFDKIRRRL